MTAALLVTPRSIQTLLKQFWAEGVGSREEAREQGAVGKGENKKLKLPLFPLCSLLPTPLPLPNAQCPQLKAINCLF